MHLARRRIQQVPAADDLRDALLAVIDDHRQVVRPHAVGAAQHHVIHRARHLSGEKVAGPPLRHIRPQPQRRPPALLRQTGRPLAALPLIQVTARPRIRARRTMRGAHNRLQLPLDVLPRAEAGENREAEQGGVVKRVPLRLTHRRTIPLHAHRPQILQLLRLELRAAARLVDVLHAHQEPAAHRARPRPRHDRRPQIPQMQMPRRRRRIPADVPRRPRGSRRFRRRRGSRRSRPVHALLIHTVHCARRRPGTPNPRRKNRPRRPENQGTLFSTARIGVIVDP